MNFLTAAREHLGLHAESWRTWLACVAGALGEPLDEQQHAAFRHVFHRDAPAHPCRELWLAIGRRGGKDYVATRLAIYLALCRTWTLAPGEVGVVLLLAVDRAQAKVAFNYLRGALEAEPSLWADVTSITADCISLRNGVEVQVGTSDFAAVRGRTVLVALLDEFAFWGVEQATEVLRALRPAQAQAMLIVISSTYASFGPFFDSFRKYFAHNDSRVLFGRATTRDMNPTVEQEFIDGELERDPAAAAAEYMSEFRTDVARFFDLALIDSATRDRPREIPYTSVSRDGAQVQYAAGMDVSGGRGDAASCAISRTDLNRCVIVAVRRWPAPHDPLKVAVEVAEFLRAYGLTSAMADQYGAEFAVAAYREAGVELMAAPVTRTEAYLHLLPLFTTGRIEIPDDPVLRTELLALERRTGASGRDVVDHPPRGHDDVANAVALAAYLSRPSDAVSAADAVAMVEQSVDEGRSDFLRDYHNADGSRSYGYLPNVDWLNTNF
jgi:predicted Fe-Mo cluster-binding NifX family protein